MGVNVNIKKRIRTFIDKSGRAVDISELRKQYGKGKINKTKPNQK